MEFMYPIMLDLAGRKVLVVGAGKVAARKIRSLLALANGAAELRVVAPEIAAEMPEGISVTLREFREADLNGIDLCFIATDNERLNAQVMELCHQRRILANRADRGEEGDFTLPAVHRSGAITVAVSASGSPRLAANVRDEIARGLDPAWGSLATSVQTLRREVLDAGLSEARRRQILLELCSQQAFAAFKQGGEMALKAHLRERFVELKELAAW